MEQHIHLEPLNNDEKKILFNKISKIGYCSKEDYYQIRHLSLNIDHKVVYIRKLINNPFHHGDLKNINIVNGEVLYFKRNRVFAKDINLGMIKILDIRTANKVKKLYVRDSLDKIITTGSLVIEVIDTIIEVKKEVA